MFGIVLRLLTFGLIDGGGICMCCGGVLVGVCTLCGIYKCSQLRLRDCCCVKWILRKTGSDSFDDFDLLVIVHEASFTSTSKRNARIRITAGRQQVQTNPSSKGVYQEGLQIFVEQGTPHLNVELLDGKTVLANLKLNIEDTILKAGSTREKDFSMQSKVKGFLNASVKVTMTVQSDADAETGLITDMHLSKESEVLLHQALQKANDGHSTPRGGQTAEPKNAIEAIAFGLKGHLEMFGALGLQSSVFAVVQGPPLQRKYVFAIFKDEKDVAKGVAPHVQIDLLKMVSVQEDPSRRDVFMISYVDARKIRDRIAFRRVDLPSSTWVELLTKLIRLLREERESRDPRGSKMAPAVKS